MFDFISELFVAQHNFAEPLPAEREAELIELAQRGDSDATLALMRAYGPELRSAVARYVRRLEPWAREQVEEDARAAVLTAFVELISTHDAEKNPRLAGRVRPTLQHALGELSRLDAALSVPEVQLSRFYSALRAAEGDVDRARRLAPEHRLSEAAFDFILRVVRKTSSLSAELDDAENEGERLLAEAIDGAELRSSYDVIEDELIVKLAFEAVDDDEARVCELSYGFTEYEPVPDAEIAHRMGFSRQKVYRTRSNALGKMRKTLGVTYAS